MDELLRHCLRELAFDGDLGCSVSRLKDFIADFYSTAQYPQNPDDLFCAFVWSLIVQQPSVRIGTLPPGITSEVWLAPQVSAKRKANAKGQDLVTTTPFHLDIVEDAQSRQLHDLIAEYGDLLRIALDADSIYAAVTGTHIRFSKMSPMVYTALQIITRGRDTGVTVVELGQRSKYDQKTCFYLVKQLTDLGLVAKVRRGGVGTHFCIHRYFFDRSPTWQDIREEEMRAQQGAARDEDITSRHEPADEDEQGNADATHFMPIDTRHLSSMPLVRSRVVKLLKMSKNQMHVSTQVLTSIGFPNPVRSDRRFFQGRIRELIAAGVVDRVQVPGPKRRGAPPSSTVCLRLLDENASEIVPSGSSSAAPLVDEEEEDISNDSGGVKLNVTLVRQLLDLLEESGTSGMTLTQLSAALCQFDRRTIELMLTRAEKFAPPAHLSDMGIAGLMETSGRERRHRYYTVRAYQKLVAQENLDQQNAGWSDVNLASVGEFLGVGPLLFYSQESERQDFEEDFKSDFAGTTQKKSKRKREPGADDGEPQTAKKRRKMTEQVDFSEPPAAPKKRGRPRKIPDAESSTSAPKTKSRPSKAQIANTSKQKIPATEDDGALPAKRRRKQSPVRSDEPPPVQKAADVLERSSAMIIDSEARNPIDESSASMPSLPPPDSDRRRNGSEVAAESANSRPVRLQRHHSTDQLTSRPEPMMAPKMKVNVSHLRRENEMCRVVQNLGGVMNVHSKDFFEAHMTLLETMAKAGEPTSAPVGTRIDKRTANDTFLSLERQGRVKRIKTAVVTPSGLTRPATVIHLPDTPQVTISSYLSELGTILQPVPPPTAPVKRLDDHVDFSRDQAAPARKHNQMIREQYTTPTELFKEDDSTIRQVLMGDRTTLSQLFGTLVAKCLRLRQLHRLSLRAFQDLNPPRNVVSVQHRVIHLSFFISDISLSEYLELIPPARHDEKLADYISTAAIRDTLVKDLPSDIHRLLEPTKARVRCRYLELFEALRALNLVSPLRTCTSDISQLSLTLEDGRDLHFEPAPSEGWTTTTPSLAPVYWQFSAAAAIYNLGSSDRQPSFWQEVPVASVAEAGRYWDLLKEACSSVTLAIDTPPHPRNIEFSVNDHLRRSLCRPAAWRESYHLTSYQTQYLKQFVDLSTQTTPLDDEGGGAEKIRHLSWVSCVPEDTIRDFFKVAQSKAVKEMEKARRRLRKAKEETAAKEAQAALAKRAADARQEKEAEFDQMMSRMSARALSPVAAARVRRVRDRFLQAAHIGDMSKWEEQVSEALREAEMASKQGGVTLKLAHNSKPAIGSGRPAAAPPRIVPQVPETSVRELIAQQGPPLPPKPKRKAKEKNAKVDDGQPKPIARRNRFQWTRDYDELARDSSAIIKARCRYAKRLDWGAFVQVFPSVPRNSVRQRLASMRESHGMAQYLVRLEDAWHDLWIQHRGTEHLPDDIQDSATEFDLIAHVQFLRAHLDKASLRAGYAKPEEELNFVLPSSLNSLAKSFDIIETTLHGPKFDFMWSGFAEEGREKRLLGNAFIKEVESLPTSTDIPDSVSVAEAALKLVIGTPETSYEPDSAQMLLDQLGQSVITPATTNLLSRGVLAKLSRDPHKQRPGKQLKISDSNQNALGGVVNRDVFQDANALEDIAGQETEWREWPLLASDGDCAALIELVSGRKVEFEVDTSQASFHRYALDWNSKKADDDHLETSISVRFGKIPIQKRKTATVTPPEMGMGLLAEYPEAHGTTVDGAPASCRQVCDGVTDCSTCLDEQWAKEQSQMDTEEVELATSILRVVGPTRQVGASRNDLVTDVGKAIEKLLPIIRRLTTGRIPFMYWVGYSKTLYLVSASHIASWTVQVAADLTTRVFPRRWLDINGDRVVEVWESALRAVVGTVLFRPGISQTELRWRLRTVYDRQELNDLLRNLFEERSLMIRRANGEIYEDVLDVLEMDEHEEAAVYWFLGAARRWYHIML